jgi:hydrogenase-1 operon protein HyaE
MRHPLIQRLFDEFDYPAIGLATHDAFVRQPGVNVLFFAGDPKRFQDTTDVAVVLPELVQAFPGQLRPGVVEEAAEIELQQRYGFRAWPALVFLRAGGYLGTITGIRNWSEYLEEIERLLSAEPVTPPAFKIPVVGA